MKAVAGKSLCSAIVISIAVVLGLMHHKAATPPAAGEAEYGFAPVEVAGHSGGPAVLDLAGTKLNIHRQDFGRNLKETRKELSARARRDGWEEIDIEQAMGQLPSGAVAGGNLAYKVYTTPDNRMVVHLFDGSSSGTTRVTISEIDLGDMVRQSVKKTGNQAAGVPDEYRDAIIGKPLVSYGQNDGTGSRLVMCPLGGATPDAAALQVRERLVRDNWTLETWPDQIARGPAAASMVGDKILVSAVKGDRLCHVVVDDFSGKTVATYRFSACRRAAVQR